MKDRTGELNEKWGKQLIKELIHQGVRYFCIAPGSRSTALTLAASQHPLANTFVHFDERALGFHALGYAKATRLPAAIIVTSGTAVGNLLPAVMEAHHDHIPLIVLTADRPPELRDTGSNQTTDQVKLFSHHVRWYHELPCPDAHIPPSFIGSTVAAAFAHATSDHSGPVHLNCLFREPFFEIERETANLSYERSLKGYKTHLTFGEKRLDPKQLEMIADELSEYEKGVIIVGNTHRTTSLEPYFTLSRLLQWPLFPDILSPLRSHPQAEGLVPFYDLILKGMSLNEDFAPDAVLQFGDRFVSKKLLEWIRMKKPKCHVLVASHEKRIDPSHSLTHRIFAKPHQVADDLASHLGGRPPSPWMQCFQEMNRTTKSTLTHFFSEYPDLSEPSLFFHLSKWIAPSQTPLFIGNSLPIRTADTFFFSTDHTGPFFGNRGLSGIDGNLATIAGIAAGLHKPLLGIVGDLTFLHDLTSLIQLQKSPFPMTLLVISNNGGGIFNSLPIAKRKNIFESYFKTPHNLNLSHSASLFDVAYEQVSSLDEIETLLLKPKERVHVIEMPTDADKSLTLQNHILAHIKDVLSSSSLSLSSFN